MEDELTAKSHADAQSLLMPLSAHALAAREVFSRNEVERLGYFKCGCTEVDDTLLLGGFSRGSIVGLSSDDETETGLLLGLQTLVRSILDNKTQQAILVTLSSSVSILRRLRTVATSELSSLSSTSLGSIRTVEECLRRVLVSCVFDIDGIWQLFTELEAKYRSDNVDSYPTSTDIEVKGATQEIQDSEDEDFSLSNDDQESANKLSASSEPLTSQPTNLNSNQPPDIILICGFSNLLTSLFAQRQRTAAHSSLALFGAQLRFLARSLSSRPLIIILNSTTSDHEGALPAAYPANEPSLASDNFTKSSKSLDPTLNSIFNLPPTPVPYSRGIRQSKPKFGLIFSQFLDVHLLCSKLPSAKEDGESMLTQTQSSNHASAVQQDTVIEILLDVVGKWQPGCRHRSREQQWAAVNCSSGVIKNRT